MSSGKGKPGPHLPMLPKAAPRTPAAGSALHGHKAAAEEKPAVGNGNGTGMTKPDVVDDERPRAKSKATAGEKDSELLDPSARLAAQLAPPMASAPVPATEQIAQRARVSLEELVPQVVRRIAWGGDRTKGSVHLELTSGDKVTVHAEGRRVRVEVDGNPDLEARIGSRLRAAGIEVERVR